jgi:hypothetical protein
MDAEYSGRECRGAKSANERKDSGAQHPTAYICVLGNTPGVLKAAAQARNPVRKKALRDANKSPSSCILTIRPSSCFYSLGKRLIERFCEDIRVV